MFRGRGATRIGRLPERWRATVSGITANVVLCDPASGSVFVSDGWAVSFASLRVHRLDLATGRHLAAARTRHQSVQAMALREGALLVATDSRLFELATTELSIIRQWDRRLVANTQQLLPIGDLVVTANWLMPSIGLFDPATGGTRRIKVGRQPIVFSHRDEVQVIAGYDGGMWTLDLERGRLTRHRTTEPMFTAAAGDAIWAVLAGRPQAAPPFSTRRGSRRVVCLTDETRGFELGGACDRLYVDDARGLIWCLVEERRLLQAASSVDGGVRASCSPGLSHPGQVFCHVDPAAGLAFALDPHIESESGVVRSATSTLACYELPSLVP